jgi:hypothetical protein
MAIAMGIVITATIINPTTAPTISVRRFVQLSAEGCTSLAKGQSTMGMLEVGRTVFFREFTRSDKLDEGTEEDLEVVVTSHTRIS